MIVIESHKNQMLELKVTGDKFHSDVKFIKERLLGRVYNPETKFWEIPILKTNFNLLKKLKTFEDDDALWAFEDKDYNTFLTTTKESNMIKIKFFYDDEIIDIIKKKKGKEDKWDSDTRAWLLKPETYNAVKKDIVNYLDKIGEKYEMNA